MPRASTADARRRELLPRIAELFDRDGYHRVSMARAAATLGLSKAALYHYFPSKEKILFAIHDEFIRELLGRIELRAGTMTPTQELEAATRDIVGLLDTHYGYVRVFLEHHRELSEDDQRAIWAKRSRYAAAVLDVVRRGIASGEFRPIDPQMVVHSLFGMTAWTVQWWTPDGAITTAEVASSFLDILLHGVGTSTGDKK